MGHRIRRTTVILWALFLFLAGLGAARWLVNVSPQLVILSFASCVVLSKVSRTTGIILLLMSMFLGGLYRGGVYMNRLQAYEGLYKVPVTLQATATQDSTYAKSGQLAFTVNSLRVVEPSSHELVGELSVEGFGTPMVYRGDSVQLTGKIYPTRGGKQGTLRFAQIQVIGHQENFIERIRHKFIAGVYTALPEPLGSFALGLLIGQRSTLPESLAVALTAAGLTHIVAVSGYNLTIIVRAVQRLRAKHSRYQTAMLSLSLMLLFVLLAGSSPSIMRAAMVSLISIIAWYYGRTVRPLLLIMLVAALTAGYYPIYLWSDIGWYLSFLAFFGVLILAPLIVKTLYSKKQPRSIALICIETFSAQIMTAPIIMYIFGRASPLGLLSNLLVVPFVPLAMLLALIAGIFGMWLPAISGFAALPARLVLSYMIDIATFFARIPHIVIERSINFTQMAYMYGVLGFFIVTLQVKNRGDRGTIATRKLEEL